MSPDSSASQRNLFALAAIALTLAAAWRFDFLVDDAFISFRYARHLAEGHGLVWNLGETPPVEGFSNFLWVVACALLELLGIAPEFGSRIVSAACAATLTWLVFRAVERRSDAATAGWSALMFAALPPVGIWATGGLETMAFATAVFGCFQALTRPHEQRATRAACVWAAAAVLLRADGFVWIALALFAAAVSARLDANAESRSSLSDRFRPVAIVASCAAGVTLAYVTWRYSYFGELGPNTARVKVHLGALALERGLQYVTSSLLAFLSIPLALAGGAFVVRRDRTQLALPALLFTLGGFAYLALVGGDWMMAHRMLTPTMPFAALCFAALLARIGASGLRASISIAAIALGVLPGFDVHLAPRRLRELAHFRWGQEYRTEYEVWRKGVDDIREWIAIGRALALFTQPGESMVLGNIGAFGYYPENLVVYDTHGLTNRDPLAPVDPEARELPGHDRKVDMGAFAERNPTYLNARIVDSRAPFDVLPEKLRAVDAEGRATPNETALAKFEFRLHQLDPELGFEPDSSLLLIRIRRD